MTEITSAQLLGGLQNVFRAHVLPCPDGLSEIMRHIDAVLGQEQSSLCDQLLGMRAEGRTIIDISPEDLFWLSVAGFTIDLETGQISERGMK